MITKKNKNLNEEKREIIILSIILFSLLLFGSFFYLERGIVGLTGFSILGNVPNDNLIGNSSGIFENETNYSFLVENFVPAIDTLANDLNLSELDFMPINNPVVEFEEEVRRAKENHFPKSKPPSSIELIYPLNKRGFTENEGYFYFNVSNESEVNYCEFILDGKVRAISENIQTNITNQFFVSNFTFGSHTWKINCSDLENRSIESETRKVIVIPAHNFTGRTTNLVGIDLERVKNFLIEKPRFGMINFTESINFSKGVDFSSYVKIYKNFIQIDSENIPELNISAILTLNEVSFENPIILKNGKPCTNCRIISYENSETLTFYVDSFSNYSASENSQLKIWDETDYSRTYVGDIDFYANYTNVTNNQPISSATCDIDFSDSSGTMNYNITSELFEYSKNLSMGVHDYNVTCSYTGFTTLKLSDTANVDFAKSINGANVTMISTSRALVQSAGMSPGSAGNITEIGIFGITTTQSWQGYYGNVSGIIELVDSMNNVLYNWNSFNPKGEIYATRAFDINFVTIGCADNLDIALEENKVGQDSNDVDSVSNTFNIQTHPQFYIGQTKIDEDACSSTNIYVASGIQNNYFYEILLSDGASNILYTAIIENDLFGFDSRTHDFEMIVSEDGHLSDTDTSTYYFYLEIS